MKVPFPGFGPSYIVPVALCAIPINLLARTQQLNRRPTPNRGLKSSQEPVGSVWVGVCVRFV